MGGIERPLSSQAHVVRQHGRVRAVRPLASKLENLPTLFLNVLNCQYYFVMSQLFNFFVPSDCCPKSKVNGVMDDSAKATATSFIWPVSEHRNDSVLGRQAGCENRLDH